MWNKLRGILNEIHKMSIFKFPAFIVTSIIILTFNQKKIIMKIVNKYSIIFLVFSAISWQSFAGAILKTNSNYYISTNGAQFHDGERRVQTSRGGLFYALDASDEFTRSYEFKKKYIYYNDGSKNYYETYSHYSGVEVKASSTTLDFWLAQDADFQSPGNSFAFEDFSFNWQFDVIGEDAWMDLVLVPDYWGGNGKSIFSLTNLTTDKAISYSSTGSYNNLLLSEGNSYLLSLNMTNESYSDGWENQTSLRLKNAIFPVPAPKNFLILLFGIVILMPWIKLGKLVQK